MLGEAVRPFRSKSQMGKTKLQNFDSPFLTQNNLGKFENRLSSSGIFSHNLPRWRSSRRFRKTSKIGTLGLKNLKIELSSCQCSTISNGQRKETKRILFQIQKSQDVREEILGRTLDFPRTWRRKEVVLNLKLQPASKNIMRESLQNFESLSKAIQFTNVCENASIWHGVSAGMCFKKTFLAWTMVLENSFQHAESTHILEHTQYPEILQQLQVELKLDQS